MLRMCLKHFSFLIIISLIGWLDLTAAVQRGNGSGSSVTHLLRAKNLKMVSQSLYAGCTLFPFLFCHLLFFLLSRGSKQYVKTK